MAGIDDLVNKYAGTPAPAAPSAAPSDIDALVNRYSGPARTESPSGGVGDGDFMESAEDEADKPSLIEAALRGGGQGATLGFRDEITAGLRSAFGPSTYREALAEERAADEKARKAHPWGFGIGEAIGGFAAPGIGEATGLIKGAGLAAHAARGAVVGGAAALGNSTADLAGGDVGGALADTAKGALMGAGIGAIVGKGTEAITRGAEERSNGRLVQDITGGRATAPAKKIYQNEPIAIDAARKFGLDKFHGDREAMSEAAEAARKEVGAKIGHAWEEADANFLGVKKSELVNAIKATAEKYDSPVEAPLRKQIDDLAKQAEAQYGSSRVPLAEVNDLAGKLESVGFAPANVTTGSAKQLQRDLAKNVNGVLDRRLAEIQEYADHIKAEPMADRGADIGMASEKIKELRALNRDYRGLKMITRMNSEMEGIPPQNRAAGGLRDAINKGVDMGILFHNPAAYVAKKAGEKLLSTGGRAADELLAKISRAARGGHSTAQAVQDAIDAGIPRSAIAVAVAGGSREAR